MFAEQISSLFCFKQAFAFLCAFFVVIQPSPEGHHLEELFQNLHTCKLETTEGSDRMGPSCMKMKKKKKKKKAEVV